MYVWGENRCGGKQSSEIERHDTEGKEAATRTWQKKYEFHIFFAFFSVYYTLSSLSYWHFFLVFIWKGDKKVKHFIVFYKTQSSKCSYLSESVKLIKFTIWGEKSETCFHKILSCTWIFILFLDTFKIQLYCCCVDFFFHGKRQTHSWNCLCLGTKL